MFSITTGLSEFIFVSGYCTESCSLGGIYLSDGLNKLNFIMGISLDLEIKWAIKLQDNRRIIKIMGSLVTNNLYILTASKNPSILTLDTISRKVIWNKTFSPANSNKNCSSFNCAVFAIYPTLETRIVFIQNNIDYHTTQVMNLYKSYNNSVCKRCPSGKYLGIILFSK